MCWSYTNIWFRLGQNSSVLLVIKTSFWHFHKQYFPLFPLKIHPKSMLFHQNCIHQFIFLLFSVQSCHFWCWRPGQRWVLSFGKLLDGPNIFHQEIVSSSLFSPLMLERGTAWWVEWWAAGGRLDHSWASSSLPVARPHYPGLQTITNPPFEKLYPLLPRLFSMARACWSPRKRQSWLKENSSGLGSNLNNFVTQCKFGNPSWQVDWQSYGTEQTLPQKTEEYDLAVIKINTL